MPFLDHLEELRWRILWSLVAIIVGTVLGWMLLDRIDIIEILKRPIAPYLPGGRLVFTSPAEPFMLTLKVAFALGCLVASPVVIYQIWSFLSPALYQREKKLVVPALFVGVILFLAGAIACYQWLLPAALKVLLNFQRTDLTAMITIDRYFGMAVPFVVGCGLVAELPLVVTILASLGIVTPQFLGKQRRYAVVIAAFLAALLTPPDAVSMMLMLVPLLLLYEISIWCAWVASRRRSRRLAETLILLLMLGAGTLSGQDRPPRPAPDSSKRAPQQATGQTVDTGTARKLGLPTSPSRSFPKTDAVMDSLLKLPGFRITHYVSDTLVVQGDSQVIFLRREAFVDRDGTQLEADSIRYQQASCRLDAAGNPILFDQGTVLAGEGMRYDTCLRRGTVRDALTTAQQGGAIWLTRGRQLTSDSGSKRVWANKATFTSDQQPVPDYHFAAGQVKWLNKTTMVARPVVLYVRDVPIMWLPFIFQDIRSGRHSGILIPRFGFNDLVRTSRGYQRHIQDFGYYFAINDYLDLRVSADWFASRHFSFGAETQYNWLNRFVRGRLSFSRTTQLDQRAHASTLNWSHSQSFDSRTQFNANINYSTSAFVVQRNSLDPSVATARMGSQLSFNKRFSWGSLSIGGNRSQEITSAAVNQSFPQIHLTPSAVNIGSWLTWSPGFSFMNTQNFHTAAGILLVGANGGVDTLKLFADDRATNISIQTPLRVGRWNWGNTLTINDVVTNRRREYLIPDSTVPGGIRRATFAQTFSTEIDWQTSINLPTLFSGTWKLQPGVGIVNTTSGPFMIKNQFSGGEFVQQGKRLAFSASISPAFFGFFPGVGPLQRIRHSISPTVSYTYAPGVKVPDAYAHAIDPTDTSFNAHSDPQQTITFGLSQNFEAKLKPPPGDTTSEPRKIKLLGISTSQMSYNFEQAKVVGRTGWQTPSLSNTISSDLLPFQLTLSHDLWRGRVGTDSAKFDPFLTSVSTGFTITPATVRGVLGLLGFAAARAPAATPQAGADSARAGAEAPPGGPGRELYPRPGSRAGGLGGPAGRAFALRVDYSSNRTRPDPTSQFNGPKGGRQMVTLSLNFSPTANWTANWHSAFDFETRQFADHFLSFERDLRRWRASFVFSKSANGNFAFSFHIALIDQSDIKFDYDQHTFARP
jgi:sec-independent protein translocase protein TatC